MHTPDSLDHNRMILFHFDSYSTALLFARFGDSVMAPAPVPGQAIAAPAPADIGKYTPTAVLDALLTKFGISTTQLQLDDGFDAWLSSDSGPIRVHLARFKTFEAPHGAIEPCGGVFKPISEMRRLPMVELNLLRQVFNRVMGNG